MRTLASMDNNNDIHIDKYGNLAIFEDRQALANVVYNLDKTVLGECKLNTRLGIDYFETVFTAQPSLMRFKAQNIEQTENLKEVISVEDFYFEYNTNDNILSYTKTVNSIYGEVVVNG